MRVIRTCTTSTIPHEQASLISARPHCLRRSPSSLCSRWISLFYLVHPPPYHPIHCYFTGSSAFVFFIGPRHYDSMSRCRGCTIPDCTYPSISRLEQALVPSVLLYF